MSDNAGVLLILVLVLSWPLVKCGPADGTTTHSSEVNTYED